MGFVTFMLILVGKRSAQRPRGHDRRVAGKPFTGHERPINDMDVRETLQHLYAEKRRIESVIASLEALVRNSDEVGANPSPRSRRGRKSMSPEEREQVSERMKKYWARRRTS